MIIPQMISPRIIDFDCFNLELLGATVNILVHGHAHISVAYIPRSVIVGS